jgi:hypothetical protein
VSDGETVWGLVEPSLTPRLSPVARPPAFSSWIWSVERPTPLGAATSSEPPAVSTADA